jgi:DNA polymerase-4
MIKTITYRKILHIDLDAFFCAVEEINNPKLKGKPFAVGGTPESRGVVASCSYAARKYGIRSAMPMARAVKLCPQLLIVSSSYGNYSEYSKQVMDILNNLSELIEQTSIDEAFVDVTDKEKTGESIAKILQTTIWERLGLPCSLGVATNKLIAKIANDIGKSASKKSGPPMAITVVPAGKESEFIAPLPVEALWGIGPKSAQKLEGLGILTIGELANYPLHNLGNIFGKYAYDIAQRAQGIDERPLVTSREIKSISRETTFSQDISDKKSLINTIHRLSESVGKRLRRSNRFGKTIKIKMRWPDFSTVTRQITLDHPTDKDNVIISSALKLFNDNWREGDPIRLIGVGISGLNSEIRQLSLWEENSNIQSTAKEKQLKIALDTLRERFGDQIVKQGVDE